MSLFIKFLNWLKKEIVFTVIFCLTIISLFFVPPSLAYANYIDWNTIFILFSLMAVVCGLSACGVFTWFGKKLCASVKTERTLCAVLVFLCFFSSMLITNDVALLTFVPFAVSLLGTENHKKLICVLVLQTIAVNTGSMLTPIGNPQNLFLFTQMNVSLKSFLLTMLPLTATAGIFITTAIFLLPTFSSKTQQKISFLQENQNANKDTQDLPRNTANLTDNISWNKKKTTMPMFKIWAFIAMFIVSVMAVLHFIPSWVAALAVLVGTALFDYKALAKVDYMLLLTFICFFIFTGNVANIPSVNKFLQESIFGKEFASGIIVSQVISNVPATLMLFPFSDNLNELLLGVNLGGLGTLVGSLASLITFKLYLKTKGAKAIKFLGQFTLLNIIFLILLITMKYIFSVWLY